MAVRMTEEEFDNMLNKSNNKAHDKHRKTENQPPKPPPKQPKPAARKKASVSKDAPGVKTDKVMRDFHRAAVGVSLIALFGNPIVFVFSVISIGAMLILISGMPLLIWEAVKYMFSYQWLIDGLTSLSEAWNHFWSLPLF